MRRQPVNDGPPPELGITRVVMRPIASPLPLGFLALAIGTFTLAGLQLGWIATSQQHQVALALMGFVVPLQAVAVVFAFLGRDLEGATGLGILGAIWLASGLTMVSGKPGHTSGALGLLLIGAATGLLVAVVAAGTSKFLTQGVFLLAALRFYFTGAYELSSSAGWKHAAGSWG